MSNEREWVKCWVFHSSRRRNQCLKICDFLLSCISHSIFLRLLRRSSLHNLRCLIYWRSISNLSCGCMSRRLWSTTFQSWVVISNRWSFSNDTCERVIHFRVFHGFFSEQWDMVEKTIWEYFNDSTYYQPSWAYRSAQKMLFYSQVSYTDILSSEGDNQELNNVCD